MKQCIVEERNQQVRRRVIALTPGIWAISACILAPFFIFSKGTAGTSTETVHSAQTGAREAPPAYSSSRLVGIMRGTGSSVVVFENAKGEQSFYRVGEAFSDGSKILSVNARSITVRLPDGSSLECFVTPSAAKTAGIDSPAGPERERPALNVSPFSGGRERRKPPERKRFKSGGYHEDEE